MPVYTGAIGRDHLGMWWWVVAVRAFTIEDVALDPNTTRVCDFNTLTNAVRFLEGAAPTTPAKCKELPITKNFTLHFKRAVWKEEELHAAPTDDIHWTEDRDLSKPSYASCSHPKTYCLPGPCRYFDMDYQYLDSLDIGHARLRALHTASTWDMVGTPRCGASFGLQMVNERRKETRPPTVHHDTIGLFFVPTPDPVPLYGIEQKCPVPFYTGPNDNLNPLWYYQDSSAEMRRYGIVKELPQGYCTGKQPPPGSRAGSGGRAWGRNAFSWGDPNQLSVLIDTGSGLVGGGVGNTYQHGIYDSFNNNTAFAISNFTHAYSNSSDYADDSNVFDATAPTWPVDAFAVPQLIPVNDTPGFTIDDAHHSLPYQTDICDLTQCAWAPTDTLKSERVDWDYSGMNCFYAEMFQWFLLHADDGPPLIKRPLGVSKADLIAWYNANKRTGNCWSGVIPEKKHRGRLTLKNAKTYCCNNGASHYQATGKKTGHTCSDKHLPEEVQFTEGGNIEASWKNMMNSSRRLGDYFPLACFENFKDGQTQTPGTIPDKARDTLNSSPKTNFLGTSIRYAKEWNEMKAITCADQTTLGDKFGQYQLTDTDGRMHYKRIRKAGIPSAWACQPKQVYRGDTTNTHTRRHKKKEQKQRNLIQGIKGPEFKVLAYPNDPPWVTSGMACHAALVNGCTENGYEPSTCANFTEQCGSLATSIQQYNVKELQAGATQSRLDGMTRSAVLACALGIKGTTNDKGQPDVFGSVDWLKWSSSEIYSVRMNAGVAKMDMATDAWAYISDTVDKTISTANTHFEPMEWAKFTKAQWVPAPMVANASFPNSVNLQQSEACSCEKATPVYRTLHTVWEEVKRPDYVGRLDNPVWKGLAGDDQNVMVVEAGYGWSINVEAQADEEAIGLQMPSNPLYQPDLILRERDVLQPINRSISPTDLLEDYFTSPNAPTEAHLEELLFMGNRTRNASRYNETTIRFQYGSCMRYPYGQLPRMSMNPVSQVELFDPDPTGKADYWVGRQAQMGYCEVFGPQEKYAFCFADGMSMDRRHRFCTETPKATHIVLGLGLRDRRFEEICNEQHKVCWIIPGTPKYPTIASVIAGPHAPPGVLENYTILVSPFNWTVAAGILGPDRQAYAVGGKHLWKTLADTETGTFGLAALSAQTFKLLKTGVGSIKNIQDATAEVHRILLGTCLAGTSQCDLTSLGWGGSVTLAETAYAPILENAIRVNHAGLTIRSSGKQPLRFARARLLVQTPRPCTIFYVAKDRFRTELELDCTGCARMPPLDRAAVVLGGAEVGGAAITVRSTGCEMPVAFMGDDTSSFAQTSECQLGTSTIKVSGPGLVYAAGLARASGTLVVYSADPALPVLIQPLRSDTLTVNRPVINISAYTGVFGDSFMRHVYSEHLALYSRLVLPVFVTLVTIIVAGVIQLGEHFVRLAA